MAGILTFVDVGLTFMEDGRITFVEVSRLTFVEIDTPTFMEKLHEFLKVDNHKGRNKRLVGRLTFIIDR